MLSGGILLPHPLQLVVQFHSHCHHRHRGPLAIPQSLLSSSVVKMMSDPSRVLGLECPWGNSHYRHHRICMLGNHLSGLAILGILFAAQNFHHSLLFVHPPEELLARKVRPLLYSCVLLPMVCTRTAVVRSATLAFTT